MAYVTTTELSARLGATMYARLTDRDNGTTANAAVAQQVITEAEAELHELLAARFATPIDLAAHPELAAVLAGRVLDIAEYRAWRGSPFVSTIPGRVRLLYEDALRWLREVAAGATELPAAGPPAPAPAVDNGPRYRSPGRTATREELDGF